MSSNGTWKNILRDQIPSQMGEEIDAFEAQIALKQQGKVDDKVFYSAADTGFISQNVYLYCASEGLATVVRAPVDRPALAEAMRLRSSGVVACGSWREGSTGGSPRRRAACGRGAPQRDARLPRCSPAREPAFRSTASRRAARC